MNSKLINDLSAKEYELLDNLSELFIGVPLDQINEEQKSEAIEELTSIVRKKMYGYVTEKYDKKRAYQLLRSFEEDKDIHTNPATMKLVKESFDYILETA
jgi:hypothetical protein